MIVCMSRRICVDLYDAIVRLRPQWHSDDDETGAIKVVMTGAASDRPAWQPHIGKRPKPRRELIAKRAKKAADPLKLVIVRDMWLTGFDAPSMHTMYVDKPMKGHGLMQAMRQFGFSPPMTETEKSPAAGTATVPPADMQGIPIETAALKALQFYASNYTNLGDLTCNPLRRRVGCDADPDEISAIKPDDDEAIQQLKANGRHYEQIHGGDVRRVVSQKGPPFLTWRPASLDHILGDT
jgi:hypothetical protein